MATLADFPELVKLPRAQRLRLAEELWFASVEDSAPIPAAQRKLLDKRWAAYKAGTTKPISLTELEQRLAHRKTARLKALR